MDEIPTKKMKKKYTPSLHWATPEKIQTGKRRRVDDMGYGISRGIKEIACGISRADQGNIMWNFQGLGCWSWNFQERCNTVLCNFQG